MLERKASAVFSPCGRYRYVLRRTWDDSLPAAVFIGLNPSTADALRDDPTIRRCSAFANAWGWGGLIMLNLFAFRATTPAVMKRRRDPVGPDNDRWIKRMIRQHQSVIACWGNHGEHAGRDKQVARLITDCRCLAITARGQPAHPLYLRGNLRPAPFPKA
jgi:hypothetical protein